jgi:hypothetical protein
MVNDGQADSPPAAVTVTIVGSPYATTEPANLITETHATLNGAATANGLASRVWFEWGLDSNFGQSTPAMALGSGIGGVRWLSSSISNLAPHQVYHCRVVVSNAVSITRGADRAFVTGGSVLAWGDNYYGQTSVPPNLEAVAIGGCGNHTLAVRSDGTVAAWGANCCGQTNVPAGLSNVVAVAGGEGHSLALRSDGTLMAWGNNFNGIATIPPGSSNVVAIATGFTHNLVLRADGTLAAWGYDYYGSADVPGGLSNFVAIACGAYHNLALRNDGTLAAWAGDDPREIAIPFGLSNVVAIAASGGHSLALRADGTLVGWGYNDYGQTNIATGLSNVVAIACGNGHNLAIQANGTLTAWGRNDAFQASVPASLANTIPVAISAGDLHSLALIASSPPAILAQPQSQTAVYGSTVYFSVSAAGAPAVAYRWQKNGANIAGATNVNLQLSNITRLDQASYRVIVINSLGTSISSTAFLRVLVPQQITALTLDGARVSHLWFTDSQGGGLAKPSNIIVQATTNLSAPIWLTITNGTILLTNGLLRFDDLGAAGYRQRFYRVIEQ